MREKPSWLQVISGGKSDEAPEESPSAPTHQPKGEPKEASLPRTDNVSEKGDGEELVFSFKGGGWRHDGPSPSDTGASEVHPETALVRLYTELSGNPPANFARSVRPERVQEAAKILPSWTVDALYKYLSGSQVWQQPSFTQAVFIEINTRMRLGAMSPRE